MVKKMKKEDYEKQNPFLNREWLEDLKREGIKLGNPDNQYGFSYYDHGLGSEQKRYSLYISMINREGFKNLCQEPNITSEIFTKEFRAFAERVILPKVQEMTGKVINFEMLFCSEAQLGLNPNQTVFIADILLRWLQATYFYNVIPVSGISVYVNLKKNEYIIYLDSNKAKMCSFNKNYICLLYSLILKKVCMYEIFDTEEKIKHLMKKLSIRCDFTKRQYSYQINSNHFVVGKKCKKQKLLELLETKNADTLSVLFRYFCIISIYNMRIRPIISKDIGFLEVTDYSNGRTFLNNIDGENSSMTHSGFCFGRDYWWKYGNSIHKFCKNELCYLLDIDIAEFLDVLCPAASTYLLHKLYALDGVEIKVKGEDIFFQADFSQHPLKSAGILEHIILSAYGEKRFFLNDSRKIDKWYIVMKNQGCRRYNYRYALVW